MAKRSGKIWIVFLVILVVLILMAIFRRDYFLYLNELKNYVGSFGSLAPIVIFIGIVIASSIGVIFPLLVAVAGLLLDLKIAFIISLLGLTAGAVISFSIARYFGRSYIKRKYIDRIKKLREYDEYLEKNGFRTIFLLRSISLIPFEVVNVAGGFSRVKFMPFLFGTMLGIIPATLIALYFAASTSNIFSSQFIIATLLNISFLTVPLFSKRIRRIIFNQ